MALVKDLQLFWMGRSLFQSTNHLRSRFMSTMNVPSTQRIHQRSSLVMSLRSASSVPQPEAPRTPSSKVNFSSSPEVPSGENLDTPIQFTTSEASQWLAAETLLMKRRKPLPWFQPHIICFSVACLLIWFGILREENDMDELIGKPLWERIPGLEKSQLITVIKFNKEKGLPTAELEARLAEVNAMEEKGLRK